MAGKRVLVTGAAGFIGSHTVDRLVADGHHVLGVDDLSTGTQENLSGILEESRFNFEKQDVSAPGAVASIVERYHPDTIIHLAALVSVPRGETEPGLNYRLNVQATHEVCEAARRHQVPRIVFASSAAVYGECAELPLAESAPTIPVSQYGYAKRISEQLLEGYRASYGIETVCFRYFNVYGPRQDPASPYSGVVSIFSDRFRVGQPVTIYGDGTQSRDFVYVGDVAMANALAATSETPIYGTFNCCTGESTSLLDLIAVLDRRFPGAPKPEHHPERAGDIKHSLGDPTAIQSALKFAPATPFAEGLGTLLAD
ncbi:MAG: NAD-dependent epimerase/dehydratase family protein [Verrucomicrobia bacterium]|nr:NAD-dependent epimerase/dehydratase family protein [Verrucomicrobiota bacterium]